MEIKQENVLAAYKTAKEAGADSTCKVLEALFGTELFKEKDNRPVTERIKTFEDACEELGNDHPLVDNYNQWADNVEDNDPNLRAFLKLRIITAALNEGWEPQFKKDEWRWYPYLWLYKSREDYERQEGDDFKAAHPYREIGGDYQTEYAGFAYAYSNVAPSAAAAVIGSRLCFKTCDLATYCGEQFIELWADFYFIRK